MKNIRRSAALTAILTASLLLSAVSCGADAGTVTADSTGDPSPDNTTAEVIPLPEGNFGGKDCRMYFWIYSPLGTTEENGDVINDAMVRRNRKIEEQYNIHFVYDLRDGWADWVQQLSQTVLAGDDSIDIAGGYGYRLANASLDGCYQNLNTISQIDFTKPWWPGSINEAGNLGGALYMALGNIDTTYYDVTYAMYFNKVLAADFKLPDLYQIVRDGKWTIDKLDELSKNAAVDVNGDSVMNENDRFGCAFKTNMEIDAFLDSCAVKITDRDSDGMPVLLPLQQHYVDVQERVSRLTGTDYVFYDQKNVDQMFRNSQIMFTGDCLAVAQVNRDMKDDFGILPYPKWDEKQDSYRTYNALGDATSIVVPNTADPDMAGCVIEALAYYGWRDILPEYYEKALKGKTARDDESADMLDIIFDNIHFDFTQFYSFSFGDERSPSMLLRMSLKKGTGLASMWASDETMFQTKMEELVNKLK